MFLWFIQRNPNHHRKPKQNCSWKPKKPTCYLIYTEHCDVGFRLTVPYCSCIFSFQLVFVGIFYDSVVNVAKTSIQDRINFLFNIISKDNNLTALYMDVKGKNAYQNCNHWFMIVEFRDS